MAAIWRSNTNGWKLLGPTGFPDEATLHQLVREAPHLLPLAGSPQLFMLGSEAALGSKRVDLLGVEQSGRPVIIEVKLGRNDEARRAVVAQVLLYAAYLQSLDVAALREVLAPSLDEAGYASIEDAVVAQDQTGGQDPEGFRAALEEHLREGRVRLVLVLDEAPADLVRLVGYLEAVTTDRIAIDLVTVATYDVDGTTILAPQRIDPERVEQEPVDRPRVVRAHGQLAEGGDDFAESIADASEMKQPELRRLLKWAQRLEDAGLARLATYHGLKGMTTLLPRMQPEGVGFVTIYNGERPLLQFWRSVFDRKAPRALSRVEVILGTGSVGQGTFTDAVSDELLDALTSAYEQAVHGSQEA